MKSRLDMADPFTFFLSFFLISLLVLHFVQVEAYDRKECHPFSCGSVPLIQFPFSNTSTPECGLYQITCANKSITMIKLEDQGRSYVVESISYEAKQLVIQDDDLLRERTHICNSLHSVTVPASPFLSFKVVTPNFTFFNCKHDQYPLLQRPFELYNLTDCTDSVLYYYPNDSLPALTNDCSVFEFPISESQVDPYGSKRDLLTLLAVGFGLGWELTRECEECYEKKGGTCSLNESNRDFICLGERGADHKSKRTKLILGTTAGVGIFLLTCFLVFIICLVRKLPSDKFFFWRKKAHDSRNVEVFLENYGSVVPKRYRYSELKKMTNSFKDNLGQGGYGSVFKGKRDDGSLVAVKVLNNLKGSKGAEFINEVASVGRTNHVNIVTLLGFCSEGSKRALVYEFMSKGSLEKFIFSDKLGTGHALECPKLFQIAIGIARGLEYLHRGCNTRIVHFDIKPHNILLDDDFCPKISDFGLAKLCPQQQSTLSMLDARGTIGYTAPEVFCRSIGGVSHKSDVYSYGMMVLEMIGGRKNIDAKAENTSEIYFPHWVYKHIELKGSLGLLGFRTEAEEDIGRKMVLVGLWCIQTDPTNRPSMSRVLEMLEGSLGSLEMPPKPYLSSPSRSCSSTT